MNHYNKNSKISRTAKQRQLR